MQELESQIRVANIIEDGRMAGPQTRMLMVASVPNKKINTKIIFPKKNSEDFKKLCKKFDIGYLPLSLTTMSSNWISIIKYLILFPYEILILFFALKKNHFDLVHISGGCWQFKGVLAAKLANIKVVWHLNDSYAPFFIRKVFSLISPLANHFIFASERTKQYYKNFAPQKTKNTLIQSPVDIKFFDPRLKYNVDEFQKKFLKKKKIIVGTVGNINPNKGHSTFLKTVKHLSSYSNEIIFFIAGPVYKSQKKYFENLKNIIRKENLKNVYFLDSKIDVRPLLSIIDIYVCSSDNEASPLSVWEAMSMEKAIISTDVGDVGKFINHGTNGLIVKKGDALALANNIIKLIDRPELRKKFGKSARLIAKNQLDLNLCVNLHTLVYQKTYLDGRENISL